MTQYSRPLLGTLFFLSAVLLALPACNTVEGAGEDIQATGDAISDTADDTKDELSD
jgi:predicted small secreted protein